MSKIKPYIMLAPVLALILSIFIGGLVMGFMQSIGYFPVVGLTDVTLKYYIEVISDPQFVSGLKISLFTAITSSTLAVMMGLLLAYLLYKGKRQKSAGFLFYKLPVIVPHTIAAFLIYAIFSQSGILSRVLFHLGFIADTSDMPSLIQDQYGIGIILAYIWKAMPFITLVVYDSLKSICERLEETALNLGANEWQAFRMVVLPLLAPTLISNFVILFAFSFGGFEIPYLLGPTAPRALPILSFIEYTNPDLTHRPFTMAINMLLTGTGLFVVGLVTVIFRRFFKYRFQGD